jgi:flavodoxin
MKKIRVAVLYDSVYGNTREIASTIWNSLKNDHSASLIPISEINPEDITGVDLLIAGSPTLGGRPTEKMQNFFKQIRPAGLTGIKIAAFDTRLLEKDQVLPLRILMKTIGYAAPKIAASLKAKGGRMIVLPEGFIVKAKSGPLSDGETIRASIWAKKIAAGVRSDFL